MHFQLRLFVRNRQALNLDASLSTKLQEKPSKNVGDGEHREEGRGVRQEISRHVEEIYGEHCPSLRGRWGDATKKTRERFLSEGPKEMERGMTRQIVSKSFRRGLLYLDGKSNLIEVTSLASLVIPYMLFVNQHVEITFRSIKCIL